MIFIILARIVFILHLAFILFVPLGGLLSLRWRRCAWLHVPAFLYGALISFLGWVCPLTPLEKLLLEKGGAAGYRGGFIEHYIVPVIYPEWLTVERGAAIGIFVLAVNLAVYLLVAAVYRAD